MAVDEESLDDERGEYHTVSSDRIVQTFEFLGAPGDVTLVLTDLGGRTRMVTHSVFPSGKARDTALENGMSRGMTESYERLDKVPAG